MIKRLLLLLILFSALPVYGQVPQNIKRVAVSGLPSATDNLGKTYVVTDAFTTSDCTVGGGSFKVRCTSDGTNWVSDTADYVLKTTQVAGNALTGDISAATLKSSLSLNNVANVDTTNAANISNGALPAGRMPALTGDVTTSAGAVTTTIANGAVMRGKADSTINGIGVVSTASVNGVAATDTQLLQITLPAGYLNNSNGVLISKRAELGQPARPRRRHRTSRSSCVR